MLKYWKYHFAIISFIIIDIATLASQQLNDNSSG